MRQKYIRCEMIPTSAGGEQQDYISGRIQLPSDIASGILEMEYRIPIIRYRGQKMPYELFRTSYSHNSTQYSHIVKLTLHFYAHIGALSHKTTPVQAHRGFMLLPLASS